MKKGDLGEFKELFTEDRKLKTEKQVFREGNGGRCPPYIFTGGTPVPPKMTAATGRPREVHKGSDQLRKKSHPSTLIKGGD